jgi:hypothetical protein
VGAGELAGAVAAVVVGLAPVVVLGNWGSSDGFASGIAPGLVGPTGEAESDAVTVDPTVEAAGSAAVCTGFSTMAPGATGNVSSAG